MSRMFTTGAIKRAIQPQQCYDFINLESRRLRNSELCIDGELYDVDIFRAMLNSNNRIYDFEGERIFKLSNSRGHWLVPLRQLLFILNNWNRYVGYNLQLNPTNIKYNNQVVYTIYGPFLNIDVEAPRDAASPGRRRREQAAFLLDLLDEDFAVRR